MKTVPLRHVAEVRTSSVDKHSHDNELPVQLCNYVDVYKNDLVTPHSGLMRATAAADEIARFRLHIGDSVLTKDSEDPSDIGVSAHVVATSPDFVCGYHLAIARPVAGTHPRYLTWALRSRPVLDHFSTHASGISRYGLTTADLRTAPIPWHPVEAQRRIADFLDDRVARIDQIITARQRQIRLLHGALASEVAGLVASDGKGWLTGSLRRFAKSCDSLRVPLSSEERATRSGKYPYYGASGVIDHVDDYLFDGPKVLVSEDGANLLLRSTAIAFVADGQYWVNNHAHILEPFDGAHDFWAARIEALDVSPWVTGSAQPKLTIDAAMGLPMSAPAQVDTRRALGRQAVDARTAVEMRTGALEKSGTLLQEYKQSLITAAVTGELDVTTAGSGIPG